MNGPCHNARSAKDALANHAADHGSQSEAHAKNAQELPSSCHANLGIGESLIRSARA